MLGQASGVCARVLSWPIASSSRQDKLARGFDVCLLRTCPGTYTYLVNVDDCVMSLVRVIKTACYPNRWHTGNVNLSLCPRLRGLALANLIDTFPAKRTAVNIFTSTDLAVMDPVVVVCQLGFQCMWQGVTPSNWPTKVTPAIDKQDGHHHHRHHHAPSKAIRPTQTHQSGTLSKHHQIRGWPTSCTIPSSSSSHHTEHLLPQQHH